MIDTIGFSSYWLYWGRGERLESRTVEPLVSATQNANENQTSQSAKNLLRHCTQ